MNTTLVATGPFYSITVPELLIHLIALPISALNIYVTTSSAVLHYNLKLVLCAQSVAVVINAISRAIKLTVIFLLGYEQEEVTSIIWRAPVRVAQSVSISTGLWIGLFLLMERVYATIRVARYEEMKSPVYNLLWIGLLVSYKRYNK